MLHLYVPGQALASKNLGALAQLVRDRVPLLPYDTNPWLQMIGGMSRAGRWPLCTPPAVVLIYAVVHVHVMCVGVGRTTLAPVQRLRKHGTTADARAGDWGGNTPPHRPLKNGPPGPLPCVVDSPTPRSKGGGMAVHAFGPNRLGPKAPEQRFDLPEGPGGGGGMTPGGIAAAADWPLATNPCLFLEPSAGGGAHRPLSPSCRPPPPPPACDIPSGCCFFMGPWTVARSPLRMLRRVAAFCRPLPPVLLLVSFPHSRSPVVGVLRLCCFAAGVASHPLLPTPLRILVIHQLRCGGGALTPPPPPPPRGY